MDQDKELEKTSLQMGKAEYLTRFTDVDRQNIGRIIELFPQVMSEQGRVGLLLAVGGTVDKPLPRKDVDLVILIQTNSDDPKRDDYPDYYQWFMQKFRIFQRILEGISAKDPTLQITEVLDPAVDEEFQNPAILKFDGSVKMTNRETGGISLEFLRRDLKRTAQTHLAQEDKPFVVLAEAK